MGRFLPVVISALILVAAWMIPEASHARLSALQSFELLNLPIGPEPEAGAEDARPKLWERVFELGPVDPASPDGADGRTLSIQSTRHSAPGSTGADELDQLAQESLIRGLRQFSAGDAIYQPLRIVVDTDSPGLRFAVVFQDGKQQVSATFGSSDSAPLVVERDWVPPDRRSILPPLLAVVIAILLRRPLIALLSAVVCGAILRQHMAGEDLVTSLGLGISSVATHFLHDELVNSERTYIIGFVFFMLAMVGVMTRSGGIRGLMDSVARRASDARRTQVATWLMGLVIFFDDYANTILVGSTMRPLTDRFRIAREKLAYLVDSTAAPVAGLSIFSTWIAYEVSTFNQHLPAAQLDASEGYAVFIRTIPYSFYCIFTILFVGMVTITGRDFGPMLRAEQRARGTGKLLRDGAAPMVSDEVTSMEAAPGLVPSAWRAVLPLLTFIFVTLLEILRGGGMFAGDLASKMTIEGFTAVLYNGSGSWPLLVGSLAGFLVAAIGAFLAGLRADILWSALKTVRAMLVGFAILYLAWMIGAVCTELGTAPFLTALVDQSLDGRWLPTLLFILAGAVAFATGSSWSTMSILLPLVVGLSFQLGRSTGLEVDPVASGQLLMVICIASVLSGAIFGDHCSPISDTTVMSSIASASDHIDHVRTQVPYALVPMVVSIVCGYVPTAYFGLSPWICLGAGSVLLLGFLLLFGKRVDETAGAS